MKPLLKKSLIILAFAVNIGLTVFGFAALLDSPYTGIRMSVCGDHACVKGVDKGSPAYGKVQPGDRLLDVAGQNISYLAFHEDPDYIRSERDLEKFWIFTRKLDEVVVKGRLVELSMERTSKPFTVSIIPAEFPLQRALLRTIFLYIVGWSFILLAYLVYRKIVNDVSHVFLLLGIFICTSYSAAVPSAVRDLSYQFIAFRIANTADFIAALMISFSFYHWVLVFPRRRKILDAHPWLTKVLYTLPLPLVAIRFMKIIDNTYMTTYGPLTLCLLAAIFVPAAQYFVEKNTVVKQQIKWVIFGVLTPAIIYAGLSSIPIMFGARFVSVDITGLSVILMPLSFAFAITKYRLMEIDNILDTAVVYGFTILALAAVETTFLSFASPYVLATGKGLPYFSVIAVLLIVFIYVPIRNFIKGLVERLFKRGRYDPEKELQQFTVSLGLCDERSALEKFSAFVKGLLRPSGVFVVKIGGRTASLIHADNEHARQAGEKILSRAGEMWEYVHSRGTCTFGYELSEKVGKDAYQFTPDLENAVFVPFITDPADTGSGYLAVLLKKWNETAYSVKDVNLLNAVSVNIANIIEAGELRRERAEIEERYRKEKDIVMKELHDGLGNILTSITVTSQAAERMFDSDETRAKDMVERIEEYSTEAIQFMCTGLTVMDNPHGDIASIVESLNDRYGGMLESCGMELTIECSEEAGRLRPGAIIVLNITRVIQEALTNIMKHSGARKASIRLERKGNGLTVTVADDGKGFHAADEKAGYGIKNMRQRIEDMKGNMEITSSPNAGTEIRFTLPAASEGRQ